jgi:holo-[acyl-carrier protein] synthase
VILGIGTDLCDIRRIERTLERFGDRFLTRVFTAAEIKRAERRAGSLRGRAATYAKRFAAKEAGAKALGTGFRHGVFLKDLGVTNLPSGQPTLSLSGGAAARLAAIVPAGHVADIHLTITDEYPTAQAFVIISARPDGHATI